MIFTGEKGRVKENNIYNSMNQAIGNQAMLNNIGIDKKLTNSPIQRKIYLKKNTYKEQNANGETVVTNHGEKNPEDPVYAALPLPAFHDPAETLVYNKLNTSPIHFIYEDYNELIEFVRNTAIICENYGLSEEELSNFIRDTEREKHSKMIVESMRSIISKEPLPVYHNKVATDISNMQEPLTTDSVNERFSNLYPRNSKKLNGVSHRRYNCWSIITRAAFNAGIYDKRETIIANTKRESRLELMRNPQQFHMTAENKDEKKKFIEELPKGTIIAINVDMDHFFLHEGNGLFSEINSAIYQGEGSEKIMKLRSGATLDEILKAYYLPFPVFYTHIDDMLEALAADQ